MLCDVVPGAISTSRVYIAAVHCHTRFDNQRDQRTVSHSRTASEPPKLALQLAFRWWAAAVGRARGAAAAAAGRLLHLVSERGGSFFVAATTACKSTSTDAIHTIDQFAWLVPKRIHLSLVCDRRPAVSPTRRERDPLSHRINGGDSPCDQRRMRGWSSRLLTGTVRFDSVAPLSCVERKIGSFASPSRDGFAFVVEATVLRYFAYRQSVLDHRQVSAIRESLRCDVMTGTASHVCEDATARWIAEAWCESVFSVWATSALSLRRVSRVTVTMSSA